MMRALSARSVALIVVLLTTFFSLSAHGQFEAPIALDVRVAGDEEASRIIVDFDRPVDGIPQLLEHPWRRSSSSRPLEVDSTETDFCLGTLRHARGPYRTARPAGARELLAKQLAQRFQTWSDDIGVLDWDVAWPRLLAARQLFSGDG